MKRSKCFINRSWSKTSCFQSLRYPSLQVSFISFTRGTDICACLCFIYVILWHNKSHYMHNGPLALSFVMHFRLKIVRLTYFRLYFFNVLWSMSWTNTKCPLLVHNKILKKINFYWQEPESNQRCFSVGFLCAHALMDSEIFIAFCSFHI